MKNLYSLLFLFLFSCGYSDIDSVPNFKNLIVTENESIELCKIKSKDSDENFMNCLSDFYNIENKPNFEILKFSEEHSINLCKLIYSDIEELLSCLIKFYEYQEGQ
jgi:hypothetical protein